jgi:hypothetical protein
MLLPFLFILSVVFISDNRKYFAKPFANLLIFLDFLLKNLYLAHCLKVDGENGANTDLTLYLE